MAEEVNITVDDSQELVDVVVTSQVTSVNIEVEDVVEQVAVLKSDVGEVVNIQVQDTQETVSVFINNIGTYDALTDTPPTKIGHELEFIRVNAAGTEHEYAAITDAHYEHVQGIASISWSVSHGLGKFPTPIVIDTSDTEVSGQVTYIDNNNLIIEFNYAFAGKAYCN